MPGRMKSHIHNARSLTFPRRCPVELLPILTSPTRPSAVHGRDEGGAIVPLFASSVAARSSRVAHGPLTAPYGELDGLRVIERWWQA